jgi:hypothetical protein
MTYRHRRFRRKAKKADDSGDDLIANGIADTFEAAKAAAIFEARTQSTEWGYRLN